MQARSIKGFTIIIETVFKLQAEVHPVIEAASRLQELGLFIDFEEGPVELEAAAERLP